MQIKRKLQAVLVSEGFLLLAAINSGSVAEASTGTPPLTRTQYRVTTFDIPGAENFTPVAINNHGLVTGGFTDSTGVGHGYLWWNGRLTVVDAPGATSTYLNDSNDEGLVAGGYHDSMGKPMGLYNVYKETWTLLPPLPSSWPNYSAGGINDRGVCLGTVSQGGANRQGWIWDGRSYSFFNVPGASEAAGAGVLPQHINNLGQVVGYWVSDDGNYHGFLKDGQTVTTFDVPGADSTVPCGINDEGDIAGYYYCNDYNDIYGFILHRGQFVTVEILGSTVCGMSSINDEGVLSGLYYDSLGNEHGFVATPEGYGREP